MLHLYDLDHIKTEGLTKYKDLSIERNLDGIDFLSFLYPFKLAKNIVEETYIRTKENEYIVKEIDDSSDWIKIVAKINLEELKGKDIDRIDVSNTRLEDSVNLAIAGTGYTATILGNKAKRRTVRKAKCSSYDVLEEIRKVYKVEYRFDTINKVIYIYDQMGEDKGSYFSDELNLRKLNIKSNTYDFATRLIPIGKDGLTIESINNGKNYVENYQYSNKIITEYWEDNRYTDAESLMEDAILKLEEISKRIASYDADVIDLAKVSKKYEVLDYDLGDTIELLSRDKKIKEKQRIVKLVVYPKEPERNTCEIANKVLRFEDMQKEVIDSSETVEHITNSDGTIDGTTIDGVDVKKIENFEVEVARITNLTVINADISNLKADKADIVDLNAAVARIGTLEATKATITELNAVKARITTLESTSATIENLNATNAKITVLEADSASIQNLLAGNLTAENIQAGAITAGSSVIAVGAIGSAQISELSASKLSAGILDAAVITVKNLNADNITVGTINGQRIANGAIDDSKVATNANIAGSKLNINDVIVTINGATTQIDGTKIQVGNKSLDVELSEQKIKADDNSTNISNNTTSITANTNQIALKLDEQTFNSYKSVTDGKVSTIESNLTKATTDISVLQGEISLKATKTEVQEVSTKIDGIEVGGRNLLLDSDNLPLDGSDNNNRNLTQILEDINGEEYHSVTPIYNGNIYYSGGLKFSHPRIEGQQYTLSFDIMTKQSANWGFYFYTDTNRNIDNIPSTNGLWKRYSYTFTQTETKNNNILFGFKGLVSGQEIGWRKLKLEKGNKATDWTPAPEDTQKEISEAKTYAETKAQEAQQAAEAYAKTKAEAERVIAEAHADGIVSAEEQARINDVNSKLQTAKNHADTKASEAENASKAYADIKKSESISSSNTYTDNKAAEIKITTDAIKLDVSNNISNISKKAEKTYVDGQISTVNENITTVSNRTATLETSVNGITGRVESVEQNVVTVNSKIENLKTINIPDTRDDNELPSWYREHYPRKIVNEFKNKTAMGIGSSTYGVLTTIVPWSNTSGGVIIQTYENSGVKYYRKGNSDDTSWISWNTIENTAGSQAKMETAKSESISHTDSKVAEIKVTTDVITQRVDNTESNISTINNDITGINTEVSNVKSRTTTLETDVSGITGRVTSAESNISTINGNITSLDSRLDTAELKITPSAITSTVESNTTTLVNKTSIISEINQTAEAIKIQASKINLVGAVTVLSDITGDLGTVTAGTIDGATILSFNDDTGELLQMDSGYLMMTDLANEKYVSLDSQKLTIRQAYDEVNQGTGWWRQDMVIDSNSIWYNKYGENDIARFSIGVQDPFGYGPEENIEFNHSGHLHITGGRTFFDDDIMLDSNVSNIHFKIDTPNPGIELKSDGGTPYIDFARVLNNDYDMRFQLLDENLLKLIGGDFGVDGDIEMNGQKIFTHQRAVNGYTRLGKTKDSTDGVMIQWGNINQITTSIGHIDAQLTFPVAFMAQCRTLIVTPSPSGHDGWRGQVYTQKLTNAGARVVFYSGIANSRYQLFWIAIGY